MGSNDGVITGLIGNSLAGEENPVPMVPAPPSVVDPEAAAPGVLEVAVIADPAHVGDPRVDRQRDVWDVLKLIGESIGTQGLHTGWCSQDDPQDDTSSPSIRLRMQVLMLLVNRGESDVNENKRAVLAARRDHPTYPRDCRDIGTSLLPL